LTRPLPRGVGSTSAGPTHRPGGRGLVDRLRLRIFANPLEIGLIRRSDKRLMSPKWWQAPGGRPGGVGGRRRKSRRQDVLALPRPRRQPRTRGPLCPNHHFGHMSQNSLIRLSLFLVFFSAFPWRLGDPILRIGGLGPPSRNPSRAVCLGVQCVHDSRLQSKLISLLSWPRIRR
jgi:hypothetical protein